MIFTSRDFPYPQQMGFASGESPPPREWYSPQGDSLSTANGIRFKGFPLSIANGIRIKCVTPSKRLGFAPRGSPSPMRMCSHREGHPLQSDWDSHQEGRPLQSEWDSLLTSGLVAARDPFPGILLRGRATQGIPFSSLTSQPRVGLEDSGVVSWIVESLRVGFRIPFDRRPPYPSGFSLPDSVIASAHRYSRLNRGTSDPSSEGSSRNSLSVSRLLQ